MAAEPTTPAAQPTGARVRTPAVRVSPDGVVAVYDSLRLQAEKPWQVVWVPVKWYRHVPGQPVSQQAVATWSPMHRAEVTG